MKKSTIVLVFLFLSSVFCNLYAQKSVIDSLENLLQQAQHDTTKVKLLNKISYRYYKLTKYEKGLNYADQALQIAEKNNYTTDIAEAYVTIAKIYSYQSKYDDAMSYCQKALVIFEKNKNKKMIGWCFSSIGIMKYYKSNYPEAINNYEKALNIFEKLGNSKMIGGILRQIGMIYYKWGNHSQAIIYYNKALKLNQESGNSKGIASVLNSIGVVYQSQSNYSKAIEYYEKSYLKYQDIGDKRNTSIELHNIGKIHSLQENYSKAIEYYEKSLQIDKEFGNKGIIPSNLIGIGSIYLNKNEVELAIQYFEDALKLSQELGDKNLRANCVYAIGHIYLKQENFKQAMQQYEEALKIRKELGEKELLAKNYISIGETYFNTGSYDKAIENYLIGLKIAEEIGQKDNIASATLELSKIYATKKKFEEAYNYHMLYKQTYDSIFTIESKKKINNVESRFELERNAKEIELQKSQLAQQEAEIEKQQTRQYALLGGLIAVLIIVILALIAYIRIRRANQKIKEQNEEIQTQSEELLATNEKLIELDEFKQGMTGMIVHDLKNPLNGIINISKSFSVEKQNSRMKQIGRQILNMVLNILDVHKYEETKMIVDKLDHSLLELSQNALNKVDFLAEQKNLIVENNILPEIGIKADKEIIERVFVNILTNAIKYTPNNGKITVNSQQSTFGGNEQTENYYKITISDTGQGIPNDQLHKVFDKFGQVTAKKSGTVRSTGLGLTFCKIAVEAHGGEIGVESEINEGTSFWFTLPVGSRLSTVNSQELTISKIQSEIESESFKFSDEEKEILEPFALQFRKHEIYDFSILRNILKQIDPKENERIKSWKEEMSRAIRIGNEERYRELINDMLKI